MVRFAFMATVASQYGGAAPAETAAWQSVVSASVRDRDELCRLLGLDGPVDAAATEAAAGFPLLVPRTYLARIRPRDPRDPLLLQVLPQADEQVAAPGYRADPLGEVDAMACPGLLSKYAGRSLIVTNGACCVHCRFCFRRHFPFEHSPQTVEDWRPALAKIAADGSIHEVILSGGDPLMLPDRQLADLAALLAEIPHVRRLRLHTRLPVMIPQRVTDDLLRWLRATRLVPIVVVHVNHPAEIDDMVATALGRLIDSGVPVLAQSVLLCGINDDIDTLTALYERLVDVRVMPYYLHQLDPVAGAAHFEVSEEIGRTLIAQLRARLPGYAVPRYVRETRGGANKEMLG